MKEWVRNTLLSVKKWKEGTCTYLLNNRCTIYDNRPSCCRNFPNIDKSNLCDLLQYCALKCSGNGLTDDEKREICFTCGAECCKKIFIPEDVEFSGSDFTDWLGYSCRECKDIQWCKIIPSELFK